MYIEHWRIPIWISGLGLWTEMSDLIIGCLCLFLIIFIKFHKNYTYLHLILFLLTSVTYIWYSNQMLNTILTLQLCCLQRKDFVQKWRMLFYFDAKQFQSLKAKSKLIWISQSWKLRFNHHNAEHKLGKLSIIISVFTSIRLFFSVAVLVFSPSLLLQFAVFLDILLYKINVERMLSVFELKSFYLQFIGGP